MKIRFTHNYDSIISLENLLEAWKEFVRGKRSRKDVQEFELHLMSNVTMLHNDLISKTYRHSPYEAFNISDPKPSNIHKARVRDRLLHHALYRTLYPFFDKVFISDSYSCRKDKGTHKAMNRFRSFAYQVSDNHTKTVWVLKCDIKKFFASIDQETLIKILEQYISDRDIILLLSKIADFLFEQLKLNLHPDKISIRTLTSGVDFLGWVHFTDHRILRTVTKKRMFRNLETNDKPEVLGSYLGLLSHGNTSRLKEKVTNSSLLEMI